MRDFFISSAKFGGIVVISKTEMPPATSASTVGCTVRPFLQPNDGYQLCRYNTLYYILFYAHRMTCPDIFPSLIALISCWVLVWISPIIVCFNANAAVAKSMDFWGCQPW